MGSAITEKKLRSLDVNKANCDERKRVMKGDCGPEGSMGTPGGKWSRLMETTFSAPEMKSQLSCSNQERWMTLQC